MGLFHRKAIDPKAPRGYCAECGAALVDKGVIEVPVDPMAKFDRETGHPLGTRKWRQWECPNKTFIPNRGWVHSTYVDYNVKAG